MFGSFPPSPLVGLRLQSLLGPGSRHCLWNHYTQNADTFGLPRFLMRFPFCSVSDTAAQSRNPFETRSYSIFALFFSRIARYASPRFRYKSGRPLTRTLCFDQELAANPQWLRL